MKTYLFAIIMFLSSSIYSQTIQGVTIGISTKQDVIDELGSPVLEQNGHIFYDKTMGGTNCFMVVILENGICKALGFSPSDEFLSGQDHYQIYTQWDSALNSKYKLKKDDTKWSTGAKDLFGDSPDLALRLDKVTFEKTYEGQNGLKALLICETKSRETITTLMYSKQEYMVKYNSDF